MACEHRQDCTEIALKFLVKHEILAEKQAGEKEAILTSGVAIPA